MAKKTDVIKMPPVTVLKSLISQAKTSDANLAELKGDFGEVISSAVSKHNLHAGAFKLVRKLEKMDAVKLMAWLTHLDDYRMKLELDKLAASDIPGLEEGEAADDKDENGQRKPMFDETKGDGGKPAVN